MEPRATYRVQEFARLAGVTVRTLHHYEATGLLVPASRTASGHRRYRQDDLLRLQQILTLKHLGFALDDIRALLAAPAYDVQAALRAQQAALEEDIIRLQGVVYALERTAAALEHAQAVDWTQVVAATAALFDADRNARASRYFPPEQLAWLTQRAAAMPPELIAQGAEAWQQLYAAFRQHANLPPSILRCRHWRRRWINSFACSRLASRMLKTVWPRCIGMTRTLRPATTTRSTKQFKHL